MPKTARLITTSRRAASSIVTTAATTPIQLLWKRYQAAAAKKRRAYAVYRQNERLEPLYESAYDVQADIANAILKARPTCEFDRSIQAEVIMRRERDLGGPCTAEEIGKLCRDIQIAAGFLAPAL